MTRRRSYNRTGRPVGRPRRYPDITDLLEQAGRLTEEDRYALLKGIAAACPEGEGCGKPSGCRCGKRIAAES